MILQALVRLYEDLIAHDQDGNLPLFGWSAVDVAFIAQIDFGGNLISILPANADDPKKRSKKILPLQLKRSGTGAPPYCLCDNIQYVFGLEQGMVTAKSRNAFHSFRAFHQEFLSGLDTPEVHAFLHFLDNWNPDLALSNPAISAMLGLKINGSIVFRIIETSRFLHDIPEVKEQWDMYFSNQKSQISGPCLVMGKNLPIARIHNSVKGIRTNSLSPNGWTLVGFDKGSPAFNSYGKLQGYNAPTSEYAAFAYTAALNYLLSDREHVQQIGDTTVVCWAEGAEPVYQPFCLAVLFGGPPPQNLDESQVRSALKKLAHMERCEELPLDPNRPFYILGLAPNAARLSVRFFLRDSFGKLMGNVNAHHERMEIVRPASDPYETIPLWALLRETVNQNSRDKSPSPVMAGAAARAILTGSDYPASLLNGVMLRIRADHQVNRGRAAILKAYFIKNYKDHPLYHIFEEVAQVDLNEQCTYLPYVLGRLFCVMEDIQLASADWKLNRSIKDSYFVSAAATPKIIFTKLFPLSEYHMKKLKRDKWNLAANLDAEKQSLIAMLTTSIPTRFTPEETNCFYLGYYHQNNKKKEENKMSAIQNRYEFVILFDVENGNPNGDPDAGNMPRIDPETGLGLVTDVCLKRKIRNYVEMVKEDAEGYRIYVKDGVPLNRSDAEAYTALKVDEKSVKTKKKDDPDLDRKLRDWMCANFFDIRAFGAVMTTFVKAALNCGQVRGPVQLGFARSVEPIVPQEVTITRVAITTEADAEKKGTEMGRKYIVPYGLYRAEGYISANLARKTTGFSEEDLELLWQAILNMFEHDRSAARGKMAVRELIVFKHDGELGNAPAWKLFDSVKVDRAADSQPGAARSYADYTVTVDETAIPTGVTCTRMG